MMRLLLVVFFCGTFLLDIGLVRATLFDHDTLNGLTVSPAFQEVILDQKEKKADFFVSITNTTGALVTLRITVFDFGSLDESGGVAFLGASSNLEKKYALASWMRPEKDVLTLQPDETQKILVTIENRDSLGPGGHYGALTFKTEDTAVQNVSGDTVAVNQLFSTLVFVKKIGGEIYNLELKGTEYQNNVAKFQDVVRLRFQNSGNVHVVPRGMVLVSDPLGRLVAKGILNEESGLILPETIRAYPVRLKTLAPSLIPGRYTMEIAYRYDGKDDFMTTSLQFDFIPLPAILAFLVFIATGGWYVAKRRRNTGEKMALSGSDKEADTNV